VLRWTDPARTPDVMRPCVVTMGNFDGVHRGHQAVIGALLEASRRHEVPAVAITFEPHPVAVLFPLRAPMLITPGEIRNDLLGDTGLDGLLVLQFTMDFAKQSPEEFVRTVFVEGLAAKAVVIGEDARFGYGNVGTVDTLRELGEKYGFEVVVLADVGDGARYSSTAVREAVRSGDVEAAAEVLGRDHRVVGTVVHGNHRGRDLGYPTANLAEDSLGLVPAEGVYAGWLTRLGLAERAVDRRMPAALSVGTNPTFATHDRRTVEAYVLDRTDLDLYGEHVMIEFSHHIRPTLRFESIDELLVAMSDDVRRSRELLGSPAPPSA
jgi:riboflavin kinase/FMN adenylyltransferase